MSMQHLEQLFGLTGKGAVVTGAGKGLGRGIALRLAEAGAGVIAADIDLEAAMQTADRITSDGGKSLAVQADVCEASDAQKVISAAVSRFGAMDILVNNAGVFPNGPVLDIDEETWDRVLDINLKGTFLYSREGARAMVEAGRGGRIINISSIAGVRPERTVAHYNASKAGVALLTKSLALELGESQITVNAVAPGFCVTPGTSLGEIQIPRVMESRKRILDRVPLGRLGEPSDIANMVLFLAGGAAAYVTGAVIPVDGGHLLS